MRLRAQGLHKQPARITARPGIAILIAMLAAFLSVTGLTGAFASTAAPARTAASHAAAVQVADVSIAQARTEITLYGIQARMQAAARAAAVLAARTYTVRSGDSISSVAAKRCGQAKDWTGIYAASRSHGWTGQNANQLSTGQHLYLYCAYVPSMLRYAPPPPPVVHVVTVASYNSTAGSVAPSSYRSNSGSTYQAPAATYHGSGTYSFAGLESLWDSAGGPSWAAPHAAEIAECESGGRTSAYNPSGATGLWQILGSVVPGNLYNAFTNALNAVAKFRASGSTFAQWVCR